MKSTLDSKRVVKFDKVSVNFPVGGGLFRKAKSSIRAVEDVSFEVTKDRVLGIVGESGCGKTTVARLALKLLPPSSGEIEFTTKDGESMQVSSNLSGKQRRLFRESAQMVFQDPFESINPRLTIFDTIAEPLVNSNVPLPERIKRVREELLLVKLTPPEQYMFRYPHELSGGQRQRVAIARAFVLRPSLIVADEPTSMLDIAVRASIIKLMLDLRKEIGTTFLYITHDMAVARYVCDDIAVMYLGRIVEMGPTERILHSPRHPYTRALIDSVIDVGGAGLDVKIPIKGSVSKPIDPPPECRFLARCVFATDKCHNNLHPPLTELDGRKVACYNPQSD